MKAVFLACLLLLAVPPAVHAWIEGGPEGPLLFDSGQVLDVTLPVSFKKLCRPREDEDCDFIPTTLSYPDAEGTVHSLPVEIRVRGGWRSLSENCSVPLLWVRFDERGTSGTVFAGQSLLPLTTHCGQGFSLKSLENKVPKSSWEQYLLKEYLAQNLYRLFTDVSLRARLVRIHYQDPAKPERIVSNYAYFTEHFDSAAARLGFERLDRGTFDHEKLDTHAADVLALYQYMIGNSDWSVVRQRNTVLFLTPAGKQVPAPYDLDMSGLVNAHYAGPPPGLPIDSVRERHYLGFCHPDLDWDGLFDFFESSRDEVMALVDSTPGLSKENLRDLRGYLNKFYTLIGSDEERARKIIAGCKPWPPPSTDHMTPLG